MEGVVGGPSRPPVYLLPAAVDFDLQPQSSIERLAATRRGARSNYGSRVSDCGMGRALPCGSPLNDPVTSTPVETVDL